MARRTTTDITTARSVELEGEIVDALANRRDDAGPWLVYADWLQQQGDPRGKLIVAHHQLALDPANEQARKAEATLLSKHKALFVPAEFAKLLSTARRTDPSDSRTEAVWRLGFLDRIKLAQRAGTTSRASMVRAIPELLAHPSATFVRAIALGRDGFSLGGTYANELAAIASGGPLPNLVELEVGTPSDAVDISQRSANHVIDVLAVAPALRKLTLRIGILELGGPLAHAALHELEIATDASSEMVLAHLATARLPALESFAFELPGIASAALVRVLENPSFARLRRLALTRTRGTAALVRAIADSPLATTLAELDLRGGDLASPDAAAVLASIPKLAIDPQARDGRASITPAQALARVDDGNTRSAAHEIARYRRWRALGRDGDVVWGDYVGSSGDYDVFANLVARESGCNCPSRDRPCKHAAALLFLAANGHGFAARPMPASARANARAEQIE